jgi:hypothetical protein
VKLAIDGEIHDQSRNGLVFTNFIRVFDYCAWTVCAINRSSGKRFVSAVECNSALVPGSQMDGRLSNKRRHQRQVGLADLFALIAFFMPVSAAVAELRSKGVGALGYVLAIPSALILGIVIVSVEWKLGRTIWLRFEKYSKKVQNFVGAALCVVQLFWIFVGTAGGFKLGALVMDHITH